MPPAEAVSFHQHTACGDTDGSSARSKETALRTHFLNALAAKRRTAALLGESDGNALRTHPGPGPAISASDGSRRGGTMLNFGPASSLVTPYALGAGTSLSPGVAGRRPNENFAPVVSAGGESAGPGPSAPGPGRGCAGTPMVKPLPAASRGAAYSAGPLRHEEMQC